jgi:predicted DNA-binding protein
MIQLSVTEKSMLNVNLPERIETRLVELSARTGKSPDAITQAALDLYLEELEDYLDVAEIKKQGGETVSLKELGKALGLES